MLLIYSYDVTIHKPAAIVKEARNVTVSIHVYITIGAVVASLPAVTMCTYIFSVSWIMAIVFGRLAYIASVLLKWMGLKRLSS